MMQLLCTRANFALFFFYEWGENEFDVSMEVAHRKFGAPHARK